ncbi:NAD-dependent epimerase/dehydratase family protein [Plantactinospora sonchi]|uniref:NAD-dependent epimerase/dehydratase family protein n=1 Tax=Plantactinospora sonchi TaxID=1544735 RepID=A0ABU7RYI1_9ACTN
MRLLVLGGTSFVGRWVVTTAVDRGWSVTTFNRGLGGWAHPRTRRLTGDRLRPTDLGQLRDGRWDAVVDTWSGAPCAVRNSADLLAERAERYLYVSSRAVYASPPPPDLDESGPTVEASPDAGATGYAPDKRGGELAVEAAFGERAVLARAGLILGPYEDSGRLPHWLLRMERGGDVLAPGPPDLPLRYIDVRDLAAWLLDAAGGGVSGAVNVVNPAGHASMRTLLEAAVEVTGAAARLVWVDPETIEAHGFHRWTELPCWVPPGPTYAGLLSTNVARAAATGLRCRPVAETVADTWAWLVAAGRVPPPVPAGQPRPGLDPVKERTVLAAWRRASPATADD